MAVYEVKVDPKWLKRCEELVKGGMPLPQALRKTREEMDGSESVPSGTQKTREEKSKDSGGISGGG